MPIHLRRALADDDIEVPYFFEGVPLKGSIVFFGWAVGLLLAGGGIAVMVLSEGTAFEAIGAVSAAMGSIALVGVVRCRRFETQVGRRWITIGAGPLTHRIRRDLVSDHCQRPGRGWRRLYADSELVLSLQLGDHQHVVPTLNPEELAEALRLEGFKRE